MSTDLVDDCNKYGLPEFARPFWAHKNRMPAARTLFCVADGLFFFSMFRRLVRLSVHEFRLNGWTHGHPL